MSNLLNLLSLVGQQKFVEDMVYIFFYQFSVTCILFIEKIFVVKQYID